MMVTSVWMLVIGGLEVKREFTLPPGPKTTLVEPGPPAKLTEKKKEPDEPGEPNTGVEPLPSDKAAIRTPAPTTPPAR